MRMNIPSKTDTTKDLIGNGKQRFSRKDDTMKNLTIDDKGRLSINRKQAMETTSPKRALKHACKMIRLELFQVGACFYSILGWSVYTRGLTNDAIIT